MRKNFYLSGFLLLFTFSAFSQEKFQDSTALMILDKMGTLVGEVKSLGFQTQLSKDVVYAENFFIKEFESSEIILKGPNKFFVKSTGERKAEMFAYQGDQVIYYSFLNNIFTAAEAPDNLIETLDWLYQDFDIEFTFADFLYPNFTSDLSENMDYIEFLGTVMLDGKRTFHIGTANENMTVQFWISDGAYFLPKKILITYLGDPYAHQVEADFSDWEINKDYPDSIFEFLPPPGANQITWFSKD